MVDDRLSIIFAALADPTRRAILARLAEGEATVTELAEPFSLSLPTISKHLKVLQQAGLISQSRQAQWRPCRLEAAPLRDIAGWVSEYRQFWDESYIRLDAYLTKLQATESSAPAGEAATPTGDADNGQEPSSTAPANATETP